MLTGLQQGLDLIARAFVTPGDTVVVERPAYVGALGAFREAGAEFIEIPLDAAGLRVDIYILILTTLLLIGGVLGDRYMSIG